MSASTAKIVATIAPITSGSLESGHGVRRLTRERDPERHGHPRSVEVVQLVGRHDAPMR